MIATLYRRRRKVDGKVEVARIWRARYRLDGDFKITDVSLETPDKQVARKKLSDIIAEREREKAGIVAPKIERDAAGTPLSVHLDEYAADLETIGRTIQYIKSMRTRVERVCRACKWTVLSDINPDGFVQWRSAQTNFAPKTLNEHLTMFSAFLNWMDRHGRIPTNPLRKVQKVDIRGRQQHRRAFTDDELQRLVAVAPHRRLLYLTAAYTGLRIGELSKLVWSDLHLDAKSPHIAVRAITTKNRRVAIVPLHSKLLPDFRERAAKAIDPAGFIFTEIANTDRFIRDHLEKAGIPIVDETGRKLDFHALRYTFATKLAMKGISQRLTQELMRHSDPKLTANIYTDVAQLPTVAAVQSLPWIEEGAAPMAESAPQAHNSEGEGNSAEPDEAPSTSGGTHTIGTQGGTQNLVSDGQNESRTVQMDKVAEAPQVASVEVVSPTLSQTDAEPAGGEGGIRTPVGLAPKHHFQ
jgi:integrase